MGPAQVEDTLGGKGHVEEQDGALLKQHSAERDHYRGAAQLPPQIKVISTSHQHSGLKGSRRSAFQMQINSEMN